MGERARSCGEAIRVLDRALVGRVLATLLLAVALLGALPAASAPAAEPAATRPSSPTPAPLVYLVPLGRFPRADLDAAAHALAALYGAEVRRLDQVALPGAAYYPPRRRYRAERLLQFLAAHLRTLEAPPEDRSRRVRVLGLTASDVSTTKGDVQDWGVVGLGLIDGPSAVVSSFRCKRRSSGPTQTRARVAKAAAHEIGHTFGLPHCPRRGCLMQDAHGRVQTFDGEADLCADCRRALAARGLGPPNATRP